MTPEFLSNHNMIICLTVFLKVKDNEFVILIKRHNLGWFLLWMKALLTLFYQLSKTITKERNICLKMIKFQLYQLSNQGLFNLQLIKQTHISFNVKKTPQDIMTSDKEL